MSSGMQAAFYIREKQKLRLKNNGSAAGLQPGITAAQLRRLGRVDRLPSNVATRDIAPFPTFPPNTWGKATSAWTGERRLTSPSEDLERNCKVKQTEAHRRWMKRNRIQDSSFGGGSSSDEDEHINSGKRHLHIQQQSTLINLLLYIGLCIISLGLIISFVGTGEKGFKTNELRLIGPSLLLVGCIFCGLRVLFCFCRVNGHFCRKKSNLHHQKIVKSQQKQAKIMSKQSQQGTDVSQHPVGLIDDTGNSNTEFYRYLPFHNRTNDFVSEPMTKSSDFDGRKRVSIIPPSKSQSSELNKTLMFNPNQLISYTLPPVTIPKTISNPTPISESLTKKEEQLNLIDLSYSASMHDLLSLSSLEGEMEANVEEIDKISINSETMKQLKSTIITLDNKDNNCIEHSSSFINNSCEDLNYNDQSLPLSKSIDFKLIESNDFSLISSDVIKYSSCDKKCVDPQNGKNLEIEMNEITNHDRFVSPSIVNNDSPNIKEINEKIVDNISDDNKLENLKQKCINLAQEDLNLKDTNRTTKENSISQAEHLHVHSDVYETNTDIDSVAKKSLRDTIALSVNETNHNNHVKEKDIYKKQKDNRENKSNNSKDSKIANLVDKVNKANSVINNLKTNSIMKDSKINSISHNKGAKLSLLDSKDLKTALSRNNMNNVKSNSVNKKVNFATPNNKNSMELIETHKKYNKSDCISLNENSDSILNSNSIQTNEHELVLNPLNLKSSPNS